MKILHVVQSYWPAVVYGGPIFSIHALCEGLSANDLVVDVSTTDANGRVRLDTTSGRVVNFRSNYVVKYYKDTFISRFSFEFMLYLPTDIVKSDLIHLHDLFSTYALWTVFLAWILKKPLVISPRGVLSAYAMHSKRSLLKRFWLMLMMPALKGDRVNFHATSKAESAEINSFFENSCFQIPNPINLSEFTFARKISKKEYFNRFCPSVADGYEGYKVAICLGRLHAIKGYEIGIKAVHKMTSEGAKVILLIAGEDGGEKLALQKLIGKLNLRGNVFILDAVSGADKINFIVGADLLLLPSHSENFGMSCAEALASGVPVVANHATPWQQLEEGGGRCVSGTPEDFAMAMDDLLGRRPESLAEEARKQAKNFDNIGLAKKYLQHYIRMIGKYEIKK